MESWLELVGYAPELRSISGVLPHGLGSTGKDQCHQDNLETTPLI